MRLNEVIGYYEETAYLRPYITNLLGDLAVSATGVPTTPAAMTFRVYHLLNFS